MSRFLPRTIRGQLIAGTVLLQCLLVTAVVGYIYRMQNQELRHRTAERLVYQVRLLSSVAAIEIKNQHLPMVQTILDDMLAAPTISAARITDLSGNTLAYSDRAGSTQYAPLSAHERTFIHPPYSTSVFSNGEHGREAVSAIRLDGTPVALAWIYPDSSEDEVNLSLLLRSVLIFAILAIAANALFSLFVAQSVTRPLRGLLRGTKLLVRDPEHQGLFPLKTQSSNEAGELTRAFNTMVAALNEQRSGLNDTLALLDSMLANAPIGFAFFDRKMRYVRVNRFLSEMNNLSISRHLGRTVAEVFTGPMAQEVQDAIERVFATGEPVRDLEITAELATMPGSPRTWLLNFYAVRTGGDHVRWVGAVVVDATQRKLSEDLLRKTEKLAATGRLAASIAHEINNPLEAVTNLLYLLHQQPCLDAEALQYAEMAQQEVARVSHITQQTLRFYRQSSQPVYLNLCELLDSVLTLYNGRLSANNVEVIRRYRDNAELFAFSGEMRQLFANLIGNAADAMPKGGRLALSVRRSRAWKQPEVAGLRVVVADTGHGMTENVRKHIFEAFFTTKEATGTGLGLWVSSEIIEKHRGTVRVRSRSSAPAEPASPAPHASTTPPGSPDLEGSGTQAPAGQRPSGTVFMLFLPFDAIRKRAAEENAVLQA